MPSLVRFTELKEKRIDGLISHASFPISTSKLEGFNDKIKVAKRIGYLPSMASCMPNKIT